MQPAEIAAVHGAAMRDTFSVGSALSRSFQIWSRSLPLFLGAATLAQLPTVVVSRLTVGRDVPARVPILANLVMQVLVSLTVGLVTHSVLAQIRGRRPGSLECLRVGVQRTWLVFATILTTLLMVAAASLILVVPGVVCAGRWALAATVVAAEGRVRGRERSTLLTEGHRGALLGLLLLLLVASTVVSILLFNLGPRTGLLASVLTETVPLALLISFGSVVLAVAYHQLRTEKEGADLEHITEVFG